jgi:ABC-type multidrug transport system fused ATPase/permease subunit
LDEFDRDAAVSGYSNEIGFKNASFSWSKDSKDGFILTVENLSFKKGKINLIVGPTGSGTSYVSNPKHLI